MENSVKLTKTQLRTMAKNLKGVYCGGNVYNYENDIFYLNTDHVEKANKNIQDYLASLKIDLSKVNFLTYQVAYSVGTHGNSGQLHRVEIWQDNKVIYEFFTYYCWKVIY